LITAAADLAVISLTGDNVGCFDLPYHTDLIGNYKNYLVSQPASQSASQPVSQSASQPVSQSASQRLFFCSKLEKLVTLPTGRDSPKAKLVLA
jgi:hypothetical protein